MFGNLISLALGTYSCYATTAAATQSKRRNYFPTHKVSIYLYENPC